MFKLRKTTEELEMYLKDKETRRIVKTQNRDEKKEHLDSEKTARESAKNEYKNNRRKVREIYKEEKQQILNKTHHFRWYNFFTKWFFLGIILMFISVCITFCSNAYVDASEEIAKAILSLLSGLFSAVGVALFVGCIFDFSKNSEAFMSFISKILSDIIVSKTFLSSLAAKDKKDALKLILQPSDKQIEQYSNINEYFKKKLDDYMKMFDTNFKTNLNLNIEAKRNKETQRVYCESVLSYTIYKVRDEFEPIKVYFDKVDAKSDDVTIIYEGGEYQVRPEDIKDIDTSVSAGLTGFLFEIPEHLKGYDHLTIRRKMYEPGHDHWISYNWQSITPYENMSCNIKCFDNLTIKEYMIFDNKAYYHSELSEDKTRLNISSHQWLEADTGFYVVISDT